MPPANYRSFSQLDFWGRLSTYVDLTPNWQLEGGISGLWGPKTGSGEASVLLPDGTFATEQERRVAGLDLRLSYVPLRNNQFRGLVWGTEVLYSDNNYLFSPTGLRWQRGRLQQQCWLGGAILVCDLQVEPPVERGLPL